MDMTIILRFAGGLGNQMFQYAAGKALAKRLGAELKLDLGWYTNPGKRAKAPRFFCLDRFHVTEPRATPAEVRRFRGHTLYGRALRKVFGRDVRINLRRIETPHDYWNLQSLHRFKGLFLHGYWQSESYFSDAREEIRAAFAAHDQGLRQSSALIREIESDNSIALHVRRGDYASEARLSQTFGTCSAAYYESSLAQAQRRLGHLRVYLFSDDAAWATHNLRLPPDVVVVAPEDDRGGLASFDLMRRCRHFIISNSTFSWWAAWLGETPKTLTFAPSPWFMNGGGDEGIVPGRWIRVDARS